MNGWTTIPHGMNVRLDYPERHNNYNAKASVSCVLFANMEVPVLDEAILVAGGKYWVSQECPKGMILSLVCRLSVSILTHVYVVHFVRKG